MNTVLPYFISTVNTTYTMDSFISMVWIVLYLYCYNRGSSPDQISLKCLPAFEPFLSDNTLRVFILFKALCWFDCRCVLVSCLKLITSIILWKQVIKLKGDHSYARNPLPAIIVFRFHFHHTLLAFVIVQCRQTLIAQYLEATD